ncbi:MAG TPA: alpha/beta hydrolase [Acidimicrobiales bacterium]|nr:alpha/beta hydrolase [Acidimicrobiales bacterium]
MGDGPALDPSLPIDEFRRQCDAGVFALHHLVRDVAPPHAVVDVDIPVTGGTVPARLYVPRAAYALPVHIHLHGGGWWMGSIDTVDPMARELAVGSGLAVLSVGYRLAPEHRWPTAPEDVYAALEWVASHPPELGFVPTSVSVGGESAGANLAAVVSLMARDRGGPHLVAQWLDVPAVDVAMPRTPSVDLYGSGYGLEVAHMPLLLGWYVDEEHHAHPYVSPALADDLSGLPPALVTTAECDPLRDQGEAYAAALQAAGVVATLRPAPGHIHASSWLTALDDTTSAWHDATVRELVEHHRIVDGVR